MDRTVAVPTDKEAAREGGTELGGGQPGEGVSVVAADEAQQKRPHSPSISCPPPQIRLHLDLGDLLLPIRRRNLALGGAVGRRGSGRLGGGGIGGLRIQLSAAAAATVMPASHALAFVLPSSSCRRWGWGWAFGYRSSILASSVLFKTKN